MTNRCIKASKQPRTLPRPSQTHSNLKRLGALLSANILIALPNISKATALSETQINGMVSEIAAELKTNCPLAAPDDQPAFDKCRQVLFGESKLKQNLSDPTVLWGRQRDPALTLKETPLTQFRPEILAGLYAPLFMFNGTYRLTYNEREKLYMATLDVAFRNRLQPGQFPYPFWHEENKWSTYENAKSMLLWINPNTGKIRVAQFSALGTTLPGHTVQPAQLPAFDGKWVWTDAQGQTQPAVTVFDGLYQADNPYKKQLDQTYKDFALALRESQCLQCHVPNNPDKMKRLVLLQSPAHASAEIQRVMRAVREKEMPLDEQGIEQALDPKLEKTLLEKGGAFEKVVNAAREWERQHSKAVTLNQP